MAILIPMKEKIHAYYLRQGAIGVFGEKIVKINFIVNSKVINWKYEDLNGDEYDWDLMEEKRNSL